MYLILIQDDDANDWGMNPGHSLARIVPDGETLQYRPEDYAHCAKGASPLEHMANCRVMIVRLSSLRGSSQTVGPMRSCVSAHIAKHDYLRIFVHYDGHLNQGDYKKLGHEGLVSLWNEIRSNCGLVQSPENVFAAPLSAGAPPPWHDHIQRFQNCVKLNRVSTIDDLQAAYNQAVRELGIKLGVANSVAGDVATKEQIVNALFPFVLDLAVLAKSADDTSLIAAYRNAYARCVQMLAGKDLPPEAGFVLELFDVRNLARRLDVDRAEAFRTAFLKYQEHWTTEFLAEGNIIAWKTLKKS